MQALDVGRHFQRDDFGGLVAERHPPRLPRRSVTLDHVGVNPNTEVDPRACPVPLLSQAMRKGEVDAVADADPALDLLPKRSGHDLVRVLSNLSAPWNLKERISPGRRDPS